jgi:hypothetical protein
MWLHVGGEFFYGCSLQETFEVLRPHGYSLLQYSMEDAMFVRSQHLRGGQAAGLEPAEAYFHGNPHLYFRNNGANATLSKALLEAARNLHLEQKHGGGRHSGGGGRHAAALLETALSLFEDHSGLNVRDVPHRAGVYLRAKSARAWNEGPQYRWAGATPGAVPA